jgi:hypothetical protein
VFLLAEQPVEQASWVPVEGVLPAVQNSAGWLGSQQAEEVAVFVDLNLGSILERVEAVTRSMLAEAHYQAEGCWKNYELAVEHRWHRYSDRMVMNRRVSSVRDFSLDGCGDSAWSRIKSNQDEKEDQSVDSIAVSRHL